MSAQEPGSVQRSQPSEEPKSPEELRADIAQTRDELGDTVEALAAKTDVKARAQTRADEVKATVLGKKDELTAKVKQHAPGAGGGGAGSTVTTGGGSGGTQQQVQQTAQRALETAKRKPLPFVAGGAALLGYLVGRGRG